MVERLTTILVGDQEAVVSITTVDLIVSFYGFIRLRGIALRPSRMVQHSDHELVADALERVYC